MHKQDSALLLSEKYTFDLLVKIADQFFAAKLYISPEIIKIKIMGETHRGRELEINSFEIESLECGNDGCRFLLLGLNLIKGEKRLIGQDNRSYFEEIYEVRELFYMPNQKQLNTETKILTIHLHSKSIAEWIGITEKQREIMNQQDTLAIAASNKINSIEFCCKAKTNSHIFISYEIKWGFSFSEFSRRYSFLPIATERFTNSEEISTSPQSITDLISIFSFLCGHKIDIERISFLPENSNLFSAGSYYKKGLNKNKRVLSNCTLIPYQTSEGEKESEKISWDTVFAGYYSLPQHSREMFNKYIKYSSIEIPEEKFIGLFRLLEKITHKKASFVDEEKLGQLAKRSKKFLYRYFDDKKNVDSLIHSIQRANKLKYNTEKCITDFSNKIPNEVKLESNISAAGINKACRLRNDIIHSNDYYVTEEELHGTISLINILLTVAMAELIGISPEYCKKYLYRHKDFHRVIKA